MSSKRERSDFPDDPELQEFVDADMWMDEHYGGGEVPLSGEVGRQVYQDAFAMDILRVIQYARFSTENHVKIMAGRAKELAMERYGTDDPTKLPDAAIKEMVMEANPDPGQALVLNFVDGFTLGMRVMQARNERSG